MDTLVSRRKFLSLCAGAGVFGIAYSVVNRFSNPFAFAGDGTGGGANDGNGGGLGGMPSGSKFIWFDRGGFVDNPDYPPVQGWDDASAQWFLDRINETSYGGRVRTLSTRPQGDVLNGDSAVERYWMAARAALQNARNDAGTAHARVVGVAWTWTYDGFVPDGCVEFTGGSMNTFTNLFPRTGTAEELSGDAGWGDYFRDNPALGTWREAVYNRNHLYIGDSGSKVVIVIAVADNEPPAAGAISIKKAVQGVGSKEDAVFRFDVTMYDKSGNPVNGTFNGRTFTNGVFSFDLKASDPAYVIDKLPAGNRVVVTEPATASGKANGDYWLINSSGADVTIKSGDTLPVTFLNERKKGYGYAVKKSTM